MSDARLSKLLIDEYTRSDGRRVIRIDARTNNALKPLGDILTQLATGAINTARLNDFKNVQMANRVREVVLRTAPKAKRVTTSGPDNASIFWTNSPDGWRKCRDLLQGLIDADVPSHQYFSDSREDDADLEIAVAEWTPYP